MKVLLAAAGGARSGLICWLKMVRLCLPAGLLPTGCLQGAGLVDEVTTCWAQISLKRCAELVREMTISVPLYYGSLFEPVSSDSAGLSDRRAHTFTIAAASPYACSAA
jgi:hypothetical protein